MNNIVELMGSFNSECNGGGSSGTNGVESIEDIPEMSDLKQDVETYKQASCATQGTCTYTGIYLMKVYETEYLPRYFSLCELYILMCVYLVGFVMCEAAPSTHNFASKVYSPHDPKSFLKAVRKEVHCRFESYSKLYIVPMFLNHL